MTAFKVDMDGMKTDMATTKTKVQDCLTKQVDLRNEIRMEMKHQEDRLRRELKQNNSGSSDAGSVSTSATDGGPIIGGNPKSVPNPYEIAQGSFFC